MTRTVKKKEDKIVKKRNITHCKELLVLKFIIFFEIRVRFLCFINLGLR